MDLPRALGRYTLVRPLGEGGQGRVYAAALNGPGGLVLEVALKLLHGPGDELWREARIGGLLRHPHLVDVYEVGERDGAWFCAMELCDGGSLAGRGPLPPRAVVDVGLQVCEALAYAHEALDLVHLDLKPANLLLRDGAVKVGDLGIATARGFAGDGKVRGTPRFMPPEQRMGLDVDARADVYALGMVLWELASGRTALDDVTWVGGDEEPPPSTAPPEWLRPVVDRCIEPDREDRFAGMRELAAALRALPVEGASLVELAGTRASQVPPDPLGNLGPAEDGLYGQQDLLARVAAALARPGVVTLKGSAGLGKTRVARAAARAWRDRAARPAYWVDLAGLGGDALLRRIADVLDLPLRGAASRHPRQVGDALAGRGEVLVVLDGFERAVEHRDWVALWAERAPQVRILLTSRIAPGVPGEVVLEVPPLAEADAVALLARRARARGAEVAGDPALAELSRRLDGVPLALELAAGRLGVLSPAEVLERLDLSLLRSGRLGLPERQATLRGALDWSWELLSDRERVALAQLAVFRGGFGLADVEAVLDGPAPLDALQALSDHSLVTSRDGRLDLLATVRAYAEERLGDRGAERRHAAWFARHGAPGASRALRGPGQARLLRERAADLPNLAAAVERAVAAGEGRLAGRAALGAAAVLRVRGPMDQGIALLSLALSVDPDPVDPDPVDPDPVAPDPAAPDPADPDPVAPDPAVPDPADPDPADPDPVAPDPAAPDPVDPDPADPDPADPDPADPDPADPAPDPLAPEEGRIASDGVASAGVASDGDRSGGATADWVASDLLRAELLVARAGLRVDAGLVEEAEEDLAAAARLGGDPAAIELVWGDCRFTRAQHAAAGEHYRRALAALEARGDPPGRALLALGAVELQTGRLAEAEHTGRRAVEALRREGDPASEARALGNLGVVLRRSGRPDEARALYALALELGERAGSRVDRASDEANLAILEAHAGRPEQARVHFEASLELFRTCGMRAAEAQQLGNLAELLLQLGLPQEARRRGEEALAVHRELGNRRLEGMVLQLLGRVEGLTGRAAEARVLLEQALACHREARSDTTAALAALELARLDLEEGDAAGALARLDPVLDALRGEVAHRAMALAVRAEARARLGEAVAEELEAAVGSLSSISAPFAVDALCAAARALRSPDHLARAEALAAGVVREGSPIHRELVRTRRLLG